MHIEIIILNISFEIVFIELFILNMRKFITSISSSSYHLHVEH
jgi:hypothetical protein